MEKIQRSRAVKLITDPFTREMIVIGFLIESDGNVNFVASTRFGKISKQINALRKLIISDLKREVLSLDALPSCVGPQVVLGDEYEMGIEEL